MTLSAEIKGIQETLTHYFDGLYQADTQVLAKAFHPHGKYTCTIPGNYLNYDLEEYFAVVDQRTPPAENGDPRNDRVLAIEVEPTEKNGSPSMAFVKAKMTMMGKDYLDFLTLIKQDGRWQIIAKVFSYQGLEK